MRTFKFRISKLSIIFLTPKQVAFLFIEYALMYQHINWGISGWKKYLRLYSGGKGRKRKHTLGRVKCGVRCSVGILSECNEFLVAYGTEAQNNVNVISVGWKRRHDKANMGWLKKFPSLWTNIIEGLAPRLVSTISRKVTHINSFQRGEGSMS